MTIKRVLSRSRCRRSVDGRSSTTAGQRVAGIDRARLLEGAIDIHVHSYPDDRPRSIDAIEVANWRARASMRAIVLKNHYDSTAGLAYHGAESRAGYRGVRRRRSQPDRRRHQSRRRRAHGRRLRRLGTDRLDADLRRRESGADVERRIGRSSRVTQNGELLPGGEATSSRVIAKHNLVLATGHSAPQEALLILREARRQGVQRMIVTHAMNTPVSMSVAEMQEAASLGAFIEFVGGSLTAADAEARMNRFADAIRQIGPEFCVLSSDLGQQGNALPPDGFGEFLVSLRRRGFTSQDVDRMAKQNPARLLGLP